MKCSCGFQSMQLVISALILLLCASQFISAAKLTEANDENCEVCVKFLRRFIDSLDSDAQGNEKIVQKKFRETCKHSKKDDNRLCYYVGGLEESATGAIGDLTKPVSWGMPAEKVCHKLYKKDEQICDLKYEKSIDLASVNLKKLKVKDLKQILSDWDEQCRGCSEKSDFIKLIEELMPKHAPEAYAKRKSEL